LLFKREIEIDRTDKKKALSVGKKTHAETPFADEGTTQTQTEQRFFFLLSSSSSDDEQSLSFFSFLPL
jgi:hypothetical protein